MAKFRITDPEIVSRGGYQLQKIKPGSISFNKDWPSLCFYGFDRIPRKLKKVAKKYSSSRGNGGISVFEKPTERQLKDKSFMWLETFKTIL